MIRFFPLALIILFAATLRTWVVNFGLPYLYYPDEATTIRLALQVGDGNLHPYSFVYPALFSYLLFPATGAYYAMGLALGWFHSVDDFAVEFINNPTWFYMIGRLTTVLFGVATVGMTYLIGSRNYDRPTGLLASLFLASSSLHVLHSHYALTDVPATFTITTATLATTTYLAGSRSLHLVAASALAGIAAATKYTGVLVGFPLLVSLCFVARHKGWSRWSFAKNVALAAASLFIALALTAPYTFLDAETAYRDLVLFQQGMNRAAGQSFAEILSLYLQQVVGKGAGIPLGLVSVGGLALLVFRHRPVDSLLLSFPVFFLVAMSSQGRFQPNWYLPMAPVFSVAAGTLVAQAFNKISRFHTATVPAMAIVALILIYGQTADSLALDRAMSAPDTRTIAKGWIERYVPAGSKILLDSTWTAPQLRANKESLIRYLDAKTEDKPVSPGQAGVETGFAKYRQYSLMALDRYEGRTYSIDYIYHEWWKPEEAAPDLSAYPTSGTFKRQIFSMDELRNRGFDYVVASSTTYDRYVTDEGRKKWPTYFRFYQSLEEESYLVQEFQPVPFESDGPTIRIYKILR